MITQQNVEESCTFQEINGVDILNFKQMDRYSRKQKLSRKS